MANVQIRGVPEDVHRRLKSQAALSGQSLNEFLLARMSEIARTPTLPELMDRIRSRAAYEGPSIAAILRGSATAVIVVDASALAELLLGRREALDALADALGGDGDQPLHAPDLIEPETLQALRRLVLAGAIAEARARRPSRILGASGCAATPTPRSARASGTCGTT